MADEKRSPHPTEWLRGSVIGSGSYGMVHLAIDRTTGALFVAKSARSDSGIESLKNETRILENLNSRHVIKCIGEDYVTTPSENGDHPTKYTLFFEYMAGGSLSDLYRNFGGALDEKVIRLFTREILRGLKYLHDNGIVHLDVKCKNVLLDSSGEIKLADFGCARSVNSSGEKPTGGTATMGGTPLWMAPEVLRNERLDFAADIWSLGCTLIEMATGRPPWLGDAGDYNPTGVMLKIAKGESVPEFPRVFSEEGSDFLSRCLVRDPRKRWTSERLLEHPFVRGDSGKGLGVVSPTSVLDVARYESDDDGEVVDRSLFLEKLCIYEKKFVFTKDLDDWVTVRSR